MLCMHPYVLQKERKVRCSSQAQNWKLRWMLENVSKEKHFLFLNKLLKITAQENILVSSKNYISSFFIKGKLSLNTQKHKLSVTEQSKDLFSLLIFQQLFNYRCNYLVILALQSIVYWVNFHNLKQQWRESLCTDTMQRPLAQTITLPRWHKWEREWHTEKEKTVRDRQRKR